MLLFAGSNVQAANADAVLTVDGIAGSHNIFDWSFETSQSGTTHLGGGGGSGQSSFGDLTMESAGNTLTVGLMRLLAQGNFIASATLTDGNITLEMRNVIVRLVGIRKPDRHGLRLNFEEFTYSTNLDSFCFNISTNQSC